MTHPQTPDGGADDQRHLLHVEWERVELLAFNVIRERAGAGPVAGELEPIKALQLQVDRLRESWRESAWARLELNDIPPVAWDILSCVLAPECLPKVAALFQQIQGANEGYPSAALLQELLAFGAKEIEPLLRELAAGGFLFRRGLLQRDGQHPLAPVRPAPGVAETLRGGQVHLPVPGALRIHRCAGWDDLVLASERKVMLREFIDWVRFREVVVDRWGGVDTGGPLALFTGPSGTGKTLAASVVASELSWPLYRVDLGQLVSKYIGDTEKNLNRLFDAAHGKKIVLQFDEADSLFGKRGDVRDARDRYANMEVSHLLARIESHRGPCILTTNLREHLDPAFTRRFQMVVVFQRPDAHQRLCLWQKLLPPHAPMAGRIDLNSVASAVNLTGGNIRNAALHAAYLAAAQGKAIDLPALSLAVWREINKDGRKRTRSDLGFLKEYLEGAEGK